MQSANLTYRKPSNRKQIETCEVALPFGADGSIVVYFADRVLLFTSNPSPEGYYGVQDDLANPIQRAKVVNFLETYKNVALISENPRESFLSFADQMVWVEAAGGVVLNPKGKLVMIHRNGRWDLPKGHREQGESFAQCAWREAEEETGVKVDMVGRLLCTTLHSYNIYGKWELKITAWYEMSSLSDEELVPQQEEGITSAEWIGADRLWDCVNSSFPTIKEVCSALLE